MIFTHKKYITRILSFLIIALTILTFSCNQEKPRAQAIESTAEQQHKEDLVKANRYLVKKDNEIISNFVKRRDWDMTLTQSGLWYEILKHGNGDSIKENNIVSLAYSISLLDGTVCYTSDSLGLKQFKVGRGGVEPGLEEAILKLKQGDKARLILQPFLAHGLIGDNNRIPARSTIIYELEVVEVKK